MHPGSFFGVCGTDCRAPHAKLSGNLLHAGKIQDPVRRVTVCCDKLLAILSGLCQAAQARGAPWNGQTGRTKRPIGAQGSAFGVQRP